MKNTLADNKQLFNVKAIADAVTLENVAEGQLGVYDINSDTTLAANATYADLPEEFRLISKLNGKFYYSFDTIKKSEIRRLATAEYSPAKVNIWEGIIESCDCIKSLTLKVSLDNDALLRRDGLSWTDTDNVVQDAPKELTCSCDCTGKGVYDNNVMTKELWKKINEEDSPYYLAKVKDESGNELADEAAIDAFIEANKEVNTDDDEANDGEKLVLVLESKVDLARDYKDLDVNYVFPRGTRIYPSITINGGESAIQFTETQEIAFEIGAGADLRAEEFERMNLYTDLNFYPQLSDGIASGDLIFQFENGKNYNTVDFEFFTDKVNYNDGDKRSFGVMLATEDTGVFPALVALFKPSAPVTNP